MLTKRQLNCVGCASSLLNWPLSRLRGAAPELLLRDARMWWCNHRCPPGNDEVTLDEKELLTDKVLGIK